MPLTRLLIASLLLVASGEARAFESLPAVSPSDPAAGPWVALRSVGGALGLADPDAPKTAFDRVVVGVDGASGGVLDASLMSGADPQPASGISARIGFAFDRFVAYGAAGVAFASAEFAQTDARDHSAAGWTLGVGLEAPLFAGVTAKVEYLYVDLDRRLLENAGDVALTPAGGQFRAGLNYRF